MWSAPPSLILVPPTLVCAGLVALAATLPRTGLLVLGSAVAWPGPPLVTGSGTAYGVGLVTGPLWTVLAGLLCLHPIGLVGRGPVRWFVLATGVVVVATGWWRARVYQGFDDPSCHRSCDVNPLLVSTNLGLADALAKVSGLASAALWAAVIIGVVVAFVERRPASGAVTLPIGAVATASLAEAWTRLGPATPEVPARTTAVLHVVAAAGVVVVATALVWQRARLVRALNGVRQELAEGGGSGGVAPLLAAALRDPAVVVGHYVEGAGYVDRGLHPIGPAEPGRRRSHILDEGRPVAFVEHDATVPPGVLADRVGPAVRTVIQNEGLQLRLEREVARLAELRRRIVERGDLERVRLERDLHDGAQQGVLALSLEVGRLRAQAAELDDREAESAAAEAASAAQLLLERLRDVARGLHPAVLEGGGLQPALRQLADSADPPFFLSVGDVGEVSTATQRAAYAIARDATIAPLEGIRVRVDGDVVIAVDSSDPVPALIRDRAAGLGAAIEVTETGWEVHLPCV